MAIETLAGEFSAKVGPTQGLFGDTKTWFGRYNWGTTVVEDGDIRRVLMLPRRILVVGGELWSGDLDTGTETLDVDVGWADNGGGSATYTMQLSPTQSFTFTNMGSGSASATGFINSGVLTGDAITDLVAAGINYRPVPLPTGPIYFSEETQVQFEVNAPSATPANAQMWLYLRYLVI
jgi:hypothetical protein